MNIFESLENLNVSEGCFNSIIDKVQRILEDNPPVVYHKFSDGSVYPQYQMFSTEQTGKVVKAKDVNAEYTKPKRRTRTKRTPSSADRRGNLRIKSAPGQLTIFDIPQEDNK